jgi:hypothetical protein
MLKVIGNKMGVAQALLMIPGCQLQREKWKVFGDGPSDCALLSGFKM